MDEFRIVGILAGKFHSLSHVSFIVCFAFLQVRVAASTTPSTRLSRLKSSAHSLRQQFFFNFGANATTYVSL